MELGVMTLVLWEHLWVTSEAHVNTQRSWLADVRSSDGVARQQDNKSGRHGIPNFLCLQEAACLFTFVRCCSSNCLSLFFRQYGQQKFIVWICAMLCSHFITGDKTHGLCYVFGSGACLVSPRKGWLSSLSFDTRKHRSSLSLFLSNQRHAAPCGLRPVSVEAGQQVWSWGSQFELTAWDGCSPISCPLCLLGSHIYRGSMWIMFALWILKIQIRTQCCPHLAPRSKTWSRDCSSGHTAFSSTAWITGARNASPIRTLRIYGQWHIDLLGGHSKPSVVTE